MFSIWLITRLKLNIFELCKNHTCKIGGRPGPARPVRAGLTTKRAGPGRRFLRPGPARSARFSTDNEFFKIFLAENSFFTTIFSENNENFRKAFRAL